MAPGSKVRPFYEKTPFFLNFRVYVFNVTNKDEMIQGSELNVIDQKLKLATLLKLIPLFSIEKPKLQEIGPYFFE